MSYRTSKYSCDIGIHFRNLQIHNEGVPGRTLNVEVIGMLVGNFLESPKNTQILILNP